MPEILARLPLGADVAAALLHGSGTKGQALSCSLACERCRWDEVRYSGLPTAGIHELQRQAMVWARTAMP